MDFAFRISSLFHIIFLLGRAEITENKYEYIKCEIFFLTCKHSKCNRAFFFLSFFFQTEKGSALHEAALFGKVDVVRVLLETGNCCDSAWSLSCHIPFLFWE